LGCAWLIDRLGLVAVFTAHLYNLSLELRNHYMIQHTMSSLLHHFRLPTQEALRVNHIENTALPLLRACSILTAAHVTSCIVRIPQFLRSGITYQRLFLWLQSSCFEQIRHSS
jgi:hypothetical protein